MSAQERAYLRKLSSHRSGPSWDYVPFIVLTTARSGSSWFLDLLETHSALCVLGELFHPQVIYSARAIGEDGATSRLVARRDRDPMGFLSGHVYRGYESDVKAVGFKLFYQHVERLEATTLLNGLVERKDVRVIHLVRRNLLHVYLSSEIAKKTQTWDHRISTETVHVDVDDCLRFMEKKRVQRNRFSHLFGGHKMLDVSYENLAKSTESELQRVWAFLEVPTVPFSPGRHRKQERRSLSEIVENYEELREAVASTPYEEFLQD